MYASGIFYLNILLKTMFKISNEIAFQVNTQSRNIELNQFIPFTFICSINDVMIWIFE